MVLCYDNFFQKAIGKSLTQVVCRYYSRNWNCLFIISM